MLGVSAIGINKAEFFKATASIADCPKNITCDFNAYPMPQSPSQN